MPKYDKSNNEITYTVKEVPEDSGKAEMEGLEYKVEYTHKDNVWTIINTVEQDRIAVAGVKKWENIPEKFTPVEVTICLYADRNPVEGKEAVLNAENGWAFNFTDLPEYALEGNGIVDASDGHTIEYSVREKGAESGRIAFTQDQKEFIFDVTGGFLQKEGADAGKYHIANVYGETQIYAYRVLAYYVTHNGNGTDTVSP